jgi:hypothetical protein
MVLEFAPDSPEVSYSRYATWRRGTRKAGVTVRGVVVHSAETPETAQIAERVCDYFAGKQVRYASTHYIVDDDSTAQSVPEAETCYGAGGSNNDFMHVEHAGRAAQTEADWLDSFGLAMLERSASLASELADRYSIPVRRLTPAQFTAGAAGFVGHADVVKATGLGSHWDPGPHFPWSYYLGRVSYYLAIRTPPPNPGVTVSTFGNATFSPVYADDDYLVLWHQIDGETLHNFHILNRATNSSDKHAVGNAGDVFVDAVRDGSRFYLTIRRGGNGYHTVTVEAP